MLFYKFHSNSLYNTKYSSKPDFLRFVHQADWRHLDFDNANYEVATVCIHHHKYLIRGFFPLQFFNEDKERDEKLKLFSSFWTKPDIFFGTGSV